MHALHLGGWRWLVFWWHNSSRVFAAAFGPGEASVPRNKCDQNRAVGTPQIQKLVNNWLVVTSFSIGVADTVADTETIMTIGGIIDTAKRCVRRHAHVFYLTQQVSRRAPQLSTCFFFFFFRIGEEGGRGSFCRAIKRVRVQMLMLSHSEDVT